MKLLLGLAGLLLVAAAVAGLQCYVCENCENDYENKNQTCVQGNPEPPVTGPPATGPPATGPPATNPPATAPPATNPPATAPPATAPPATAPPATAPPATAPPATAPPATAPPATAPPATAPPATAPPATAPPATAPPATAPPATAPPATAPPATAPPATAPPATAPPATAPPATAPPATAPPATDPDPDPPTIPGYNGENQELLEGLRVAEQSPEVLLSETNLRFVREVRANDTVVRCVSAKYEANGTSVVRRGCSFGEASEAARCSALAGTDATSSCRVCAGDLCNAAHSVGVAGAALLLTVLVSL